MRAEIMQPGRHCPVHYRYAPSALATALEIRAQCIYLIGGLYGNEPALDAIFELAVREPVTPTLVFNGDFNWFNVDATSFAAINHRVLAHIALRGNVETEIAAGDETAGCGCGYPDFVSDADVARSNEIIKRLRETSCGFPALRRQLGDLPMYARAQVGSARIAIVHGDCETLAGWGLSQEALADAASRKRAVGWFESAKTDVIASSHSCLPILTDFKTTSGRGVVINNGAAGMPNFRQTRFGVITRIGTSASPHAPLYGTRVGDVAIEAVAVPFDAARWQREFEANWPAGSPAQLSYHSRIMKGPNYGVDNAIRLSTGTAPPIAA